MSLFVPGGVRQKPHYYPNKAHFVFLAGEQKSSICRSKAIFRATLKRQNGKFMNASGDCLNRSLARTGIRDDGAGEGGSGQRKMGDGEDLEEPGEWPTATVMPRVTQVDIVSVYSREIWGDDYAMSNAAGIRGALEGIGSGQ